MRATLALGMALIYSGEDGAPPLREATAILDAEPGLATDPTLLASAAIGALWLREAERGRVLIAARDRHRPPPGRVGALPFPLWLAGRDAATSDRPHVAVALYEEAIRLARETGQATTRVRRAGGPRVRRSPPGPRALPRHAAEALELARQLGLAFFELWALDALAELELGRREPRPAVEHLRAKQQLLAERGIADPDVSPVPDSRRAIDRATRRSSAFAHAALAKGQPWSLARLARAQGEYERALDLHARTPDRFETARTLLAQGEALRRARQRAQAREPAPQSHRHVRRARRRPVGRARPRASCRPAGRPREGATRSRSTPLTPRELQVALVVAEGHTIRETAGKLFLSPQDRRPPPAERLPQARDRLARRWLDATASPGAPPMRAPDGAGLASRPCPHETSTRPRSTSSS